jgi:trk system potassium uptake protein TrkA
VKILVVGGGPIAYFLVRNFLAMGHSVTIVNRDPAECRTLARRLKAAVIQGDGSFPQVLDEAGAHEADVVLAITPSDDDNLVICQVAQRQFKVPRTVAVVNDPDNEEVFPQLGVRNVVSITRIVSTLIEERTGVEEITNVMSLGEGRVHVTELEIAEDAPVLGRPLAEIPLPEDALIGCILRATQVIVPHGATMLKSGDRVILITVPQTHDEAVNTLTGEA